jgi:hypothetical protein
MSIPVSIQGTTYNIPEQGQNPPWGSDLTDLLQALVDVANTSIGSADIITTSFNLGNNQASATNVTGLAFDPSQVRSAIISYSISRSTSTNEYSECGQIYITYRTSFGNWELAQYSTGSSGVTFTVTNGGQFQYVSDNMSGLTYVGKMKFNARAFLQA